ncbi:MAG TPA: questin oxidase family protein [Usitatibacter sp.]|nr:questin oxidase family protein [Usitatibacter sp.]
MIRPGTRSRIEAAHRYSAFYDDFFATHYPMALVSLDAMGADDAALDRFGARYLPRLEPMAAAVVVIAPGDEAAHLGSPRAFPEWVAYFDAAIADRGIESVLARWIDRLLPACGAAAFHGAIRTAYALESGSAPELAHALAYWAAVYEPLPQLAAPSGRLSCEQVLAAIAGDGAFAGKRPPGRSIIQRARAAARMPNLSMHAASTDAQRLDLDSIARAMLGAYAASGDFTLLHCVTGTHAFRLLMPYAGDVRAAVRDLWASLLATYVGSGAPFPGGWGLAGSDSLDWPAIHARALDREDEHDIKLAYTCWREWQHRGDDLYRRAASARLT